MIVLLVKATTSNLIKTVNIVLEFLKKNYVFLQTPTVKNSMRKNFWTKINVIKRYCIRITGTSYM